MTTTYLAWERDDGICGEAAALHGGGRHLDLTAVVRVDGAEVWWDVSEGAAVLAQGYASSTAEARRAAEDAARLRLLRTV